MSLYILDNSEVLFALKQDLAQVKSQFRLFINSLKSLHHNTPQEMAVYRDYKAQINQLESDIQELEMADSWNSFNNSINYLFQ